MSLHRRLLVTGGRGRLARTVVPIFVAAGWDVTALGHSDLDVIDRSAVLGALSAVRPDAVLNLAAWTDVDACERSPGDAHRVNTLGVRHVAEACRQVGAHLCHLSSDYVFGGSKPGAYVEDDVPDPISEYGATKRAGELEAGPEATIVRTAWLSGRPGPNVIRTVLGQASDPQRSLRYVTDQRGSPTVADDLAAALVTLVSERLPGIFHVTNAGAATWYEVARWVLMVAGDDPDRVQPIMTTELDPPQLARRPASSVLENAALRSAGIRAPGAWEEAFARLVEDLVASDRSAPWPFPEFERPG